MDSRLRGNDGNRNDNGSNPLSQCGFPYQRSSENTKYAFQTTPPIYPEPVREKC